ncbi:hypothetical protein EV651_111182 [Kribbella sp. VKM Ac-2571]|uniref:hypothetical protein n=1 Tax=Kribbella sp. VKM Ac-2571 TaxID=2512222 RepID=UPI001060ECE9|nr:hypothetical protein [Kribbella sp. VKM Ac-2571]TDO57456.1 hypothetical protein EV651_111182 [Kribbella sp. VKM Ac-2571]
MTVYEVRIAGRLDPSWSGWFTDFMLTSGPDHTTTLRGTIADQSELHGLLARIRDLGLPLISVTPTN